MQLQTSKLYTRGLPSAKPRPTFRPRKHVKVRTGPIREPQSRTLTRTKGKDTHQQPIQTPSRSTPILPPGGSSHGESKQSPKHYRVVLVGEKLINNHGRFPLSGLSVSRVYSEAQVTPIPRSSRFTDACCGILVYSGLARLGVPFCSLAY